MSRNSRRSCPALGFAVDFRAAAPAPEAPVARSPAPAPVESEQPRTVVSDGPLEDAWVELPPVEDKPPVEDHGQTLVPASVTTSPRPEPATTEDVFGKATPPAPSEEEDNFDADRVFGRLKDVDFGE